jgi:RNA polymerase sigma-70 factor (ECF subfamily)
LEQQDWLAQQFEERRAHLAGVAYRMLGSRAEADDAVQEAWMRAQRAETSGVTNLGGWLTTIVSRVCLDMLRSRIARREEPIDAPQSLIPERVERMDPESEAVLADSVGMAMMVVLDTLAPAERVAFVLHDLFDIPFDQIASIVGRSEPATRQLASRARRRVRGQEPPTAEVSRRDEIVRAFLAASREGKFEELLKVLDPSVVVRADARVIAIGAPQVVSGAENVARVFSGWRMLAAQPALLAGKPGLVWIERNEVRVAFAFDFAGDRIAAVDLIGEPEHVKDLAIELL